ncbi:MAG TPA: methyltransferase domain-containing protein, partial [Chthoniobacterales bacterium]|nr:methyltransferase domain-containing protein [Chthoniobacterales bacterium]
FCDVLDPRPGDHLLDVGGYPDFWKEADFEGSMTILNVHPVQSTDRRIATVVGDGTNLTYPDRSFDIVFSNSVIEHLGTLERQERFANECARVGQQIWVQTPARSFPIEPHYLTPFIHFFPISWRRKLLRNWTVWGWMTRPSEDQIESSLGEIRLLNYVEMRRLFPDCRIIRERVLGLTKSYIAVRARNDIAKTANARELTRRQRE